MHTKTQFQYLLLASHLRFETLSFDSYNGFFNNEQSPMREMSSKIVCSGIWIVWIWKTKLAAIKRCAY